jgi:hypothetical protein
MNIHAPVGFRTHNLSRRTAADLRLRLGPAIFISHSFIRRRYLNFEQRFFFKWTSEWNVFKRQQDASKMKWDIKGVSLHGANTEVCLVVIKFMFQKRKDVIWLVCVCIADAYHDAWWLSFRIPSAFPYAASHNISIWSAGCHQEGRRTR